MTAHSGYLVGVDVGTTSIKVSVHTISGQPIRQSRITTPWTATCSGAETTGSALLDATREVLNRALADLPSHVEALGVASIGESGVLLDRRGQPVGPVVAWYDRRDDRQIERRQQEVGAEVFGRRTGLPPAGQWSSTKHRWLLEKHPELAEAPRRLNIAEWIVRGLGGEEASELSLASRTGWLDLPARDWWSESLAWSGARASLLPPLVDAGTPLGRITDVADVPKAAAAVLTVAGHDHQVAAIGAGACANGDALDSCGSAEALIRTVAPGLPADDIWALAAAGITVGWHALPAHWALLGGTRGGLLLQHTLTALGIDHTGLRELDRRVLDRRGLDPLQPVPAEGDRRFDPAAIPPGADPVDMWLTALSQAAAEARSVHDHMAAVVGVHEALTVTGGWTNSRAYLEIKRRTLGRFQQYHGAESGARGAALMAGLAAGAYRSPADFPACTIAGTATRRRAS